MGDFVSYLIQDNTFIYGASAVCGFVLVRVLDVVLDRRRERIRAKESERMDEEELDRQVRNIQEKALRERLTARKPLLGNLCLGCNILISELSNYCYDCKLRTRREQSIETFPRMDPRLLYPQPFPDPRLLYPVKRETSVSVAVSVTVGQETETKRNELLSPSEYELQREIQQLRDHAYELRHKLRDAEERSAKAPTVYPPSTRETQKLG